MSREEPGREITSPVLATSGMVAELFSLLGALSLLVGPPQSRLRVGP